MPISRRCAPQVLRTNRSSISSRRPLSASRRTSSTTPSRPTSTQSSRSLEPITARRSRSRRRWLQLQPISFGRCVRTVPPDRLSDYQSNIASYPKFHEYFRKHKPAVLAVWGKNDPFFLPAGAEAFRRDLPDAEIHFIESGHFPLETDVASVARIIRAFLARVLSPTPTPSARRLDADAAPIEAQGSLYQMQQLFGFVPNLAVAMADEP